MTIQAKDFSQRVDLDIYVRNEIGSDIQANRIAGHTIEGLEDDLKKLSLGINSRIYGVKVVII